MEFSFRVVAPADRAWIYATKRACMRPHVEATWGAWNELDQRARFDENFDPAETRVIAERGCDVGYVATARELDALHVHNLMIAPEHQSRGVGAAVMRLLQDEARALGLPLLVQVLKVNPARRFYERLGFAVVDETATHARMRWEDRDATTA